MGSRGVFITLEGGEGTGKTTQIRLMQAALAARGLSVVTTREPGGTPGAEKLRELLVQRDGGNWDPLTETLLLFAGRRDHLVNRIWPAMESGQWVISDRFADSTRAYQGIGKGLDSSAIETLYTLAVGDFRPDLTFILDVPAEVGLERSARRNKVLASTEDRFERLGIVFHEKLRQGYLAIAAREKDRCCVIDAMQSPEAVHDAIMAEIGRRFFPADAQQAVR